MSEKDVDQLVFEIGTVRVAGAELRTWIAEFRAGASAYEQCGGHEIAANLRRTADAWEARLDSATTAEAGAPPEGDEDIAFTHVAEWEAANGARLALSAPEEFLPRLWQGMGGEGAG